MALSALHRATPVDGNPTSFTQDSLVSSLIASSIESLRSELQDESGPSKYALVLTIRTLAVCEIHSGKSDAYSWRVHVEGAKALLQTVAAAQGTASPDDPELQWLVDTWYGSIESLMALTTTRGLTKSQLDRFAPRALIREAHPDHRYLDTYTAYSTDLNVAFQEIGAAAWERRRINEFGDQATLLSNKDLDEESEWLEFSVRAMIGKPVFRPSDLQVLSHREIREYQACDEAYQETALIHIPRRVRQLPRSDIRVQEHVKRTLRRASQIQPSDGLSPWVMLTTPVFAAGCEALANDRDVVRGLLRRMFQLLRIPTSNDR
ncbi:hypothetical protein LTR85_011645 [Meristemomyces frigidus]|nr:hypothetical protein LTR85_011645 [Meristemomyces frigidus]